MFYQGTKTMKAAVIGTIMPWSGALSRIPDGWIICDGSSKPAKDYPLLVQAIGNTYNLDDGNNNLSGSFPNYEGDFVLPNLNSNGRHLMDIEEEYFDTIAQGGTGKAIDTDSDARNIIAPYIGVNTDSAAPTVFTDVRTDVVFTLNDRLDYSGNISGNQVVDGVGEKIMYIGGRKLGHKHIRQHVHSGTYETLNSLPATRSSKGVVPWDNYEIEWTYGAWNNSDAGGDGEIDELYFRIDASYDGLVLNSDLITSGAFDATGRTGFGGGLDGRTVARVGSENPPVNLYPFEILDTPIANLDQFYQEAMPGGTTIDYALGGSSLTVPSGMRNFYPDVLSDGYFGTFTSNSASDWLSDDLVAHAHEPFEIAYDQGSLKPQSRIVAAVNIPVTTILDNVSNAGALQIDMNTSQPSLTCVYIIRAY